MQSASLNEDGESMMPLEAKRSSTEQVVDLRSTFQDLGVRKKNRAASGGKSQIKGSSTPNSWMNKRRRDTSSQSTFLIGLIFAT